MIEEYFTFDDVLIIPSYSEIESRETINTSVNFLGKDIKMPIISANMDYVTGPKMLKKMWELGALGILNRFYPWEEQLKDIVLLSEENIPIIFSLGIRNQQESFDRVKEVVDSIPELWGICIDVAHAHHKKVGELIDAIKSSTIREISSVQVIAGNIATPEGVDFLYSAGADAIKVGIGAGSVCTTRTVAGVGIPQLSSIMDCDIARTSYPELQIIADGGIRNSGDLAKAIGAGANMVMIGNLFAGAEETPGPTRMINGIMYKMYRGQSIFGTNGTRYVKEGIEGLVPAKGPVENILQQLQGGLRSSMSYIGADNIETFRNSVRFAKVSAHTLMENATRVTEMVLDGN